MSLKSRYALIPALSAAAMLLGSCGRDTNIVKRSLCPAVAVAQYAGDVTRFDPPESREAGAIDISAALTNLRGDCIEGTPDIMTRVHFDVVARRRNAGAARAVTLPVFVAAVRSGEIVVSKEATQVALNFAAGSKRAMGSGSATVAIARAAVSLPAATNKLITRERKPGDADAATDPLAEPKVKEAVRQATFEVLVGFQLGDAELAYNANK